MRTQCVNEMGEEEALTTSGSAVRLTASDTGANVSSTTFEDGELEAVELKDEFYGRTVCAVGAADRLSGAGMAARTVHIPDPTDFFRDLHAGIWQDIRQFFSADETQVGMLSTLAGEDELRSARIFTDASGVPYFRDAGNLMLSINDIERRENVLVIASTYNEALSDSENDTLSGAVFTHMAWVFDGGRSAPVSVGVLRGYLGELTDAKKAARQITDSSFVKGWVLTGRPGGR